MKGGHDFKRLHLVGNGISLTAYFKSVYSKLEVFFNSLSTPRTSENYLFCLPF